MVFRLWHFMLFISIVFFPACSAVVNDGHNASTDASAQDQTNDDDNDTGNTSQDQSDPPPPGCIGVDPLPPVDFYVDQNHPAADDNNPGTPSLPWLTIQKAANTLTAGQTVVVKTGDYDERVIIETSGTAQAPITYMADPPRSVKTEGFQTKATDIRISGFEMEYQGGSNWKDKYGVYLDNGSHGVRIDNNDIHGFPNTAVVTNWDPNFYPTSTYIGYNKIYYNPRGISAHCGLTPGSGRCVIECNDIERLVDTGTGDTDYIRVFGPGDPNDGGWEIRNNLMHGTSPTEVGASHVDGVQIFNNGEVDIQHVTIANNMLRDFFHQGVIIEGVLANGPAVKNIEIINNIFVANPHEGGGSWGVVLKDVKDVRVAHNTFVNMLYHNVGIVGPESNATIVNNIMFGGSSFYFTDSGGTIDRAEKNLLYKPDGTTDPQDWPDDIVGDPQFVDPANGDYRLSEGSSAIDAGATDLGIDYDINIEPRPRGAGYDIGAHESH